MKRKGDEFFTGDSLNFDFAAWLLKMRDLRPVESM
jgi:hypothetical protein